MTASSWRTVAPAEAAQQRAQRGGRRHALAQHGGSPARPQRIRVIDAVASGQRRGHSHEQFVADMRPSGCRTQIDVRVRKLAQSKMRSQRRRQQQACVSHQPLVVEGHA